MKVLIVDDEPLARDRLRRLLARVKPEAEVEEASDGNGALQQVEKMQPDLILLDIRMPGMDGIEVAEQLQSLAEPPAIVFCTAYDHYALQALEREAVAYLLKPVREQQLSDAIARAGRINRVQLASLGSGDSDRSHITSDSRLGLERIAVEEIRCFVAEQKYVRAYYPGGSLLIPDTLKELESEFAGRLVRVHRNTLVAIAHVTGLRKEPDESWSVELADVEECPAVSRRHLGEVRKKLRSS